MTQVKFYRVETLPETGEVGSLYFVYSGVNPKLYVYTTAGFELYSDLFNRDFSTLSVDAFANAGDGVTYFTPDTHLIIKDGVKYGADLTGYATESWVKELNYLTEHQDVSNKVDVTDFEEATKVASATLNFFHSNTLWQTEDTYVKCDKSKTLEEAISGESNIVYFTTDSHQIVLNGSVYSVLDLTGYATEQWVENKGYLTEHQDISGKVDVTDFEEAALVTSTALNLLKSDLAVKEDMITGIQNDASNLSQRVETLETSGGGGTQPLIVITTYAELKALRDSGKLVVGQQYRITDYVATTSDPETQSANHPFDIIVTADSANVLNENARAIQHEGDEYFATSNLAAWKLKYCLDNDTERFGWAQAHTVNYILDATTAMQTVLDKGITLVSSTDTTYEGYPYKFKQEYAGVMYCPSETFSTMTTVKSVKYGDVPIDSLTKVETPEGKGVIYQLIDEHNNDIPYDFKGILVNAAGVFNYMFTENSLTETEKIDGSLYTGNVADDAATADTIKPKNCKMAFSKSLCKGASYRSSDWECGSGSTGWASVVCLNWKCGNNCCDWSAQLGFNWVCEHNCSDWSANGGDFHIFAYTNGATINNMIGGMDFNSKGTLFIGRTSSGTVKQWYPADQI